MAFWGKKNKSGRTRNRAVDFEEKLTQARDEIRKNSEEKYLEVFQDHIAEDGLSPGKSLSVNSVGASESAHPEVQNHAENSLSHEIRKHSPEPDQVSPDSEVQNRPDETAFSYGDIFYLEDKSIIVFKSEVPDKEYDFVYLLEPDGKVQAQGICLYAYERMKIGHLPDHFVEQIDKSLTWDRDVIVYHLDEYGFTKLIPYPFEPQEQTQNGVKESSQRSGNHLVRGRQIVITLRGRRWEAVYWGKDALGTVVAHKTSGEWSLMHLDLNRFTESLQRKNVLSEKQIREIESKIAQNFNAS